MFPLPIKVVASNIFRSNDRGLGFGIRAPGKEKPGQRDHLFRGADRQPVGGAAGHHPARRDRLARDVLDGALPLVTLFPLAIVRMPKYVWPGWRPASASKRRAPSPLGLAFRCPKRRQSRHGGDGGTCGSHQPDEPTAHDHIRQDMGLRPGGFGLLLTQANVDELLYNEKQNEVVFVKYLTE